MAPADAPASRRGSCSPPAARGGSGRPKQLLPFGGATLLDHALGTARACGFDQLLVRARRQRGRGPRRRSTCAAPRWSSTRASARAARRRSPSALAALDPRVDVLVLLLGDQPGVTPRDRARPARRPRRRRRWPSAATTTAAGTRSRSAAQVFGELGRSTATRPSGSCSTSAAAAVVEVPGRRAGAARRRHVGGLRGGAAMSRGARPRRRGGRPRRGARRRRRSSGGSASATTSPTRASPPRCSSRCASPSRCCWRARPASARPRRPRRWRRALDTPLIRAAVLRGHRRRRGALRVELPAPAAADPARRGGGRRARRGRRCSATTTSCGGRCWRRSSTRARCRRCC